MTSGSGFGYGEPEAVQSSPGVDKASNVDPLVFDAPPADQPRQSSVSSIDDPESDFSERNFSVFSPQSGFGKSFVQPDPGRPIDKGTSQRTNTTPENIDDLKSSTEAKVVDDEEDLDLQLYLSDNSEDGDSAADSPVQKSSVQKLIDEVVRRQSPAQDRAPSPPLLPSLPAARAPFPVRSPKLDGKNLAGSPVSSPLAACSSPKKPGRSPEKAAAESNASEPEPLDSSFQVTILSLFRSDKKFSDNFLNILIGTISPRKLQFYHFSGNY
jgi:hypothetical protein